MGLYLRVLWRFRLLVAVGLVLAIALAFASLVRVGFSQGSVSLSYRQQPTWQSTTRLFVTQEGFPWGRSVFPTTPAAAPPTGSSGPSGLAFADPGRFAGLAVLYAQFINGDLIQRQIRKAVPQSHALSATAVTDPATNSALPLIDVMSLAHTPSEAVRVSRAGADLFRSYIAEQQASADIPANQRVLLQVVSTRAIEVEGRKKTPALVAFLAVMIATVGLAFVLENLRPRSPAVAPADMARPIGTARPADTAASPAGSKHPADTTLTA